MSSGLEMKGAFGRVGWKTVGEMPGTWVVEVEAIGEFVSTLRRDLFLVGVSVTTWSRAVSTVRGRIGEGGRSRRLGFGFVSGSGGVFAIRNISQRCEQRTQGVEDSLDTRPGIERHFPPGGVRVVHKGARRTATLASDSSPSGNFRSCRRLRFASHLCLSVAAALSVMPFSSSSLTKHLTEAFLTFPCSGARTVKLHLEPITFRHWPTLRHPVAPCCAFS